MFIPVEVQVGGKTYRLGRLDVFEQWDVARKLLPVITGGADVMMAVFRAFGPMAAGAPANAAEAEQRWQSARGEIAKLFETKISDVVGPLSQALSQMTQEDSRFIINTCLNRIQVQQHGGAWASLMAQGNVLAFADLELVPLLTLVVKVLEVSLKPFSFGPLAPLS